MATVSTYLNFQGQTEEAFNFYRTVFGTDFRGGIARFRDIPPIEGMPPLPEAALDQVMHVALPILGGHLLMGTDAVESMGFKVNQGNNVYINLFTDTREETEHLFQALSDGGQVEQPLQDMFWGDYYGSFQDRFGVKWMVNCPNQ